MVFSICYPRTPKVSYLAAVPWQPSFYYLLFQLSPLDLLLPFLVLLYLSGDSRLGLASRYFSFPPPDPIPLPLIHFSYRFSFTSPTVFTTGA